MVLSGAERQKRFREKLKAAAREGVTPEMIVQAARLIYDREASDPLNRMPPWEDFLLAANKRGNRTRWTEILPTFDINDPEDVAFAHEMYGSDAELLLKVSPIVRAVTIPPSVVAKTKG